MAPTTLLHHIDLNAYELLTIASVPITLFQVLYILKHLFTTKRYYTASNYSDNVNIFIAMLYYIINGEGGGSLAKLLIGQPLPFISSDFKLASALIVWFICTHVLFRSFKAKQFFVKAFNLPFFKYIFILPHESRRAIAMCVNIMAFIKLAKLEGHASTFIFPAFLGFLSAIGGGLLMNVFEAHLVKGQESYAWSNFLGDSSITSLKIQIPFITSLFYALSYHYIEMVKNEQLEIIDWLYYPCYYAIYICILGFVSVPIINDVKEWLTSSSTIAANDLQKVKKE
ncbi:hypothetical protein ABK040_000941 [Willaertia magna]